MSHSSSLVPFEGPPVQMPWQQTMIKWFGKAIVNVELIGFELADWWEKILSVDYLRKKLNRFGDPA